VGLVGSGGSITTNYTYQPFGATTAGGSASGNSYEFTGRENDGTGLYFYRARYYSPTFQRFIAQDPIGFTGGDVNLYGYSTEDPVDNVDSSGLCSDPGGSGIRFCIEQYIPEKSAWWFQGDNRGPMPNGGTFRDQQMLTPGPGGYQSKTKPGLSCIGGICRPAAQGPSGATGCDTIHAWNKASGGWGFGHAPSTGYDVTITINPDGPAQVSGVSSAYPNMEIWEYGRGDPQKIQDNNHGVYGPGALFPPILGGGQLNEW
jgi:RHS repeat-associated protein